MKNPCEIAHDTGNNTLEKAATPLTSKVLASHSASELAECPRKVIRGESLYTPHTNTPKQVALTDYLNITFPFENNFALVSEFVPMFRDYFGNSFGALCDRGHGLYGYHNSYKFENGSALFAYGGASQKGTAFLSLPGEGCALINDWHAVVNFIEILGGRITRWDGAVDDYEGKHSVDLALQWYVDGHFTTGGNKPKMKQIGNWVEPDGSGRTVYIGKRTNGKMLRVYEKGKQLGDKSSPWVRWEVELNNRDRFLPSEVLLNQRPFIAGAYSCLDWVSDEVSRIKTTQKTGEISYEHLVACASSSYGRFLGVMRDVEGSPEAAFKKLIKPGKPKRLSMPGMTEMLGDK